MWFGKFGKKRAYLDYAGATPVALQAARAVARAARLFGNPGAIHAEGVEAARALEAARASIAAGLAVKAREVVFVSGGTEANNLAILGHARNLNCQGDTLTNTHWITSAIEHPSVLECFAEIERLGGRVTHMEPDARGIVSADSVGRALRPETRFVSIQWANHEIGTIQPLRAIARAIRAHEERDHPVILHTDMGQAPLYLSPQAHTLGVDLASLDSGKLYGPRGIGALVVLRRDALAPVIVGGSQERSLRAGTENVALATGFAEALRVIGEERDSEAERLRELRNRLALDLCASIPGALTNGSLDHALPHILNVSIPRIASEYVTLALDRAGLAISTKSACKEGEARSHVVASLAEAAVQAEGAGGGAWRAENTLRISLGRATRARDLSHLVETLVAILAKHRA